MSMKISSGFQVVQLYDNDNQKVLQQENEGALNLDQPREIWVSANEISVGE